MASAPCLLGALLWLAAAVGLASARSDCQCIAGFDPDDMPKMNVTSFSATSYPNGTSIYAFDLDYWPGAGLASCGAALQGQSGVFVPVGGDEYCWNKADDSFVPVYWSWNQSWPAQDYILKIDSKYLVTAMFCYECVDTGTHNVSHNDLSHTWQQIEYDGRKNFQLRPKAVHG